MVSMKNTKTDGYFEMMDNGKLITCVYGKLKNGEPKVCMCCGREVTNYFDTVYVDENDNEIFGTYGTECFKKIANWNESVVTL